MKWKVCESTPSSKLSQDSGICLKILQKAVKQEVHLVSSPKFEAANFKIRQNITHDVLFSFSGLGTKSDFKSFKLFPSATRTPFLHSKGTIWYTSQPSHHLLKGTAASTSNNLLK
jgi:hypothetical protein